MEVAFINNKLVLFDLDGTLVDSSEVVFESFNYIFQKYNKPLLDWSEFIKIFGRHPKQVFKDLNYSFDDPDTVAKDFFEKQMSESKRVKVYDNACEAISDIKNNGIKVGIYTNANSTKTKILITETLRLAPTDFDIILTGDDVTKPKPDPQGILICLKKLAISPNDAIYVGDSIADIMAADSAKVRSVLVTQGEDKTHINAKPTYTIENLAELLKLL